MKIILLLSFLLSFAVCGQIPSEDLLTREILIKDKCIIISSKLIGVSGTLRSQLCCKEDFTENSKNIITDLHEDKHSLEILKSHIEDFEDKDGKSNCKHQARYIYEKKTVFGNRINTKKPKLTSPSN